MSRFLPRPLPGRVGLGPQRGFTIVEAMLGIAVFTIVALAMAGTFLIGYRAISNETADISAGRATSDASIWLTRDLNSADTQPTGTIAFPNPAITFTYGAGATTVSYSVDANRNLIRTVAGSAQVAARGITSVTIGAWTGCYGTITIQPSAAGEPAVVLHVSNRPGGCV
jgi:type II secretory pathway pseudopilin PulG